MSEKQTRKTVLKALKSLDAQPVENICVVGYPDVDAGIGGHIELKNLDGWPKREDTPVTIPHYTAHQKLWLLNRWRKGGKAWLLVQCKQEWFLFDAIRAQKVGSLNRQEMQDNSLLYCLNGLDEEKLISWLTEPINTLKHIVENGC